MFKGEIIILLVLSSFSTVSGQDSLTEPKANPNNQPVVINTTVKKFGTLEKNSKAVYSFEITNLDEKPMVIWHVTTSCGCTSPTWTKKPIKKGEVGTVKVKYDTSQTGKFEKSVFVYTNFNDRPIKLTIEGTVEEKPVTHSKAKSGYSKSEVRMENNFNPVSK